MTTARELPIRLDMAAIAAFCRARGISRLSLFGSVLRSERLHSARFSTIRRDQDGALRAILRIWRGDGGVAEHVNVINWSNCVLIGGGW